MSFTPFFLPTADGQRFCVHHAASGETARGAILYLHPFAEEMNKSRRMAALQSRALASAGYEVLQIDLLGCGDSSGDFGDATWAGWLDDAVRGIDWLRARCDAPLWLWGLRLGGLLAAEAARHAPEPAGLVVWNPVISGKQHLQQFLRLKLAGNMLGGDGKGAMAALRQRLAAGEGVEVAGYLLSATLAADLETRELVGGVPLRAVIWLETSTRADATVSPATQACIDRLRTNGGPDLRVRTVQGPAFWQTTEIEDAPALIAATLEELADAP